MKWGHIISDVAAFYLKFAAVCLAYFAAKILTAQNRPSRNPPFAKRIRGYLWCIGVVAVIALVAWVNYNRGATVFIALLIPVLFGATEGYRTREEFPKNFTLRLR